MKTSGQAVIDSGLALLTVLDSARSETATRVWKSLHEGRTTICAPHLWRYEVTSVIHKYLFDRLLEPDEALEALQIALDLGVKLVDDDEDLCRAAFRWASNLGQKVAYNGFYLALAERLGADFWTADDRLANRARQIGVTWIHSLGDA